MSSPSNSVAYQVQLLSGVKNLTCAKASKAVADGYTILVLSDRGVDERHVPIPSLLATGAVHHHLIREGTRTQAGLVIESVLGVGSLETEHVELLRSGDGELNLYGWSLGDGTGYVYYFPDLTLYKGAEINLNTRTGQDTVEDLFWGLPASIWRSGKTVSLYDSEKELRSSYNVP